MTAAPAPSLQQVAAQKVAYIAVRGSYELIPGKMVELAAWFGRQAVEVGGQPGATYHNSPSHAEEDELSWEVWIPTLSSMRERPSEAGRIGVKTMPGGTYAALVHVGTYETLDRSIDDLLVWAARRGHHPAGSFETVFTDDPAEVEEGELRTVVRFPVATAPRGPGA